MTLYIFILGIIALGSLVYFLITKNIVAKRIAKIFGLIFVGAFLLFFTFIYFHIGAEDKVYLESFSKPEVKRQIENYLDAKVITANFGGKVFCSYKFLGALGIEDRDEVYIWALCEEYYSKQGVLTQGTGASLPVALVFKKCEIVEHKEPRDGSLYSQDIKAIFPSDVQKEISREQDFISNLSSENRLKAESNLNI